MEFIGDPLPLFGEVGWETDCLADFVPLVSLIGVVLKGRALLIPVVGESTAGFFSLGSLCGLGARGGGVQLSNAWWQFSQNGKFA